jgi:hypothetical protein
LLVRRLPVIVRDQELDGALCEDGVMPRSSTSPTPKATAVEAVAAPAPIELVGKPGHEIVQLCRQVAWFKR